MTSHWYSLFFHIVWMKYWFLKLIHYQWIVYCFFFAWTLLVSIWKWWTYFDLTSARNVGSSFKKYSQNTFFLFGANVSATISTAKNTVISPNFLVWKFCGKAHFPYSFGQFARKLDEITVFSAVFYQSFALLASMNL